MFEVSQICHSEFEVKGSKFLGYLIPFSQFSHQLKILRESHPKAVHFVYASRVMDLQIQESFSDDGEPKGSSGVPTLNVLRGENLVNVGLVSVRYFGGTLLGVGGLVRAYTQSAKNAIDQAKKLGAIQPYCEMLEWSFEVNYTMLQRVLYLAKKHNILIKQKDFLADFVVLQMYATQKSKEEFEVVWNA